jgi:hypothetical protein
MGGSMNTLIFLIEFYPYSDHVHAIYEEFNAANIDEALIELKKDHPNAEILNTYVHTMCMEDV